MADPTPLLNKSETPQTLRLDRANRHGLITVATGSGKTVTLQIMAEAFSRSLVRGVLGGLSRRR